MKIMIAVASTTHLDLHNEKVSKSCLEDMALQIRSKYIPQLINHDFSKQVGVLLYGEAFPLEDGEFALYVVSGIFENKSEKQNYKLGSPNTVWKKYKHYLHDSIKLSNQRNSRRKSQKPLSNTKRDLNIADLLETHLDSTHVLPDGRVYKIKRFIAATGDLRIEVYPKDHRPKHFHVISKQRAINARFDLETLELIDTKSGKVKRDDIRKIQNFFETYPKARQKLESEYKRMNS